MRAETSIGEVPLFNYMIDAAQRTILFWDVMRQRGNAYREHLTETAPHVLDYRVELVVDGRKLDRASIPERVNSELKRRTFGQLNRSRGACIHNSF